MWLTGATVVDGSGRDPVDDLAILVEDGTIARVGGAPPPNAEVIDCSGMTIVPGLIDAHAHVGLCTDFSRMLTREQSVAELAADIFAICGQALDAGFTTLRDTAGIDAGVADLTASGKVRGPRLLPSAALLCQTGGHGHLGPAWEPPSAYARYDVPGLRTLAALSDGPDEMRRNVRENFRRGATQIKLCVTGGVVSDHDELSDTQLSVDEIAVAVQEAQARGTYVTVHAINNAGIRNAVAAGVRCVEHASQLDEETAALMAAHDVALVPTLTVAHLVVNEATGAGLRPETAERARQVAQSQFEAVSIARAAGVRIGSGSDLIGPKQANRGLELVLRSGVEDPMAALVSATSTNAAICAIADEVGTIEPGKRADLTVFTGNPLTDPTLFNEPTRIALVIQNGTVTKDTR